ncbi:MAG: phosphoribosylglycinamide formyltransferase [Myxococcales bacterium]|nr:phosphoribosylglycinamide formyltransferase [Myxococcales bacterium]
MSEKLRLAVFLSGSGSNFEAIAKNCAEGQIFCEVAVVVSNVPDAYGLVRAKKYGIPTIVCDHREYATRQEHEAVLRRELAAFRYDLVVLAGWMRLLSGDFIQAQYNRRLGLPGIVNIHPADTAAYQGVHGYEFAMGLTKKGPRLTETKITVHFIDAGMDTGPVIAQRVVPILPADSLDDLRSRGLQVEWELYSRVLNQIAHGRVHLADGRVRIEE